MLETAAFVASVANERAEKAEASGPDVRDAIIPTTVVAVREQIFRRP